MKKFLIVCAISAFAACGSGDNSTNYSDSASAAPPDTTSATIRSMPDTARIMQDTNHVMGDTTNPKKDSMLR